MWGIPRGETRKVSEVFRPLAVPNIRKQRDRAELRTRPSRLLVAQHGKWGFLERGLNDRPLFAGWVSTGVISPFLV